MWAYNNKNGHIKMTIQGINFLSISITVKERTLFHNHPSGEIQSCHTVYSGALKQGAQVHSLYLQTEI